jgi:phosphoenolpyruvate carboxylase
VVGEDGADFLSFAKLLFFPEFLFFTRHMKLAIELRSLVHESVALLGIVIKHQLGNKAFQRIERIRQQMTLLRDQSDSQSEVVLEKLTRDLQKITPEQRQNVAHAFTLMLELMNTSENAYRSFRLNQRQKKSPSELRPQSITYVLTAHPTEARSPENIDVFHHIQTLLIEILESSETGEKVKMDTRQKNDLLHFLELAWRTPIVRQRSPKVKDEADYIYSQVFRDDVLFSLMDANHGDIKFGLASWVGGDKDGHPGVDEKTMLESLTLSRNQLLKVVHRLLQDVRGTVELVPKSPLSDQVILLQARLRKTRILKKNDFKEIQNCTELLVTLQKDYQKIFGSMHPQLRRIAQILKLFPGLVIPLELRESSDVLMSVPEKNKTLAIDRMLQKVGWLCGQGNPRVYIRGFIIAMTQSAQHLRKAAEKQKIVFGAAMLPIIPLFEEAISLANSVKIMEEVLADPVLRSVVKKYWNSNLEMMVGYSDSSKEGGVLPSRLAIARALPKLEKLVRSSGFTPIFFHGSGGSVDRGGGNIEDQMSWWPRSAIFNYKVTIQGEMVERSMATPAIARRQLEKIANSASLVLSRLISGKENSYLKAFSERVTQSYRKKITAPDFLSVVSAATPYSYINVLKIGSRPAKRQAELTVKGLRAIPWILCWTQTRLLFPTWWGVGSAWRVCSAKEKRELKKAFRSDAAFTSYVKALDFTLAKVELAVFKNYLNQSGLPSSLKQSFTKEVESEFRSTCSFVQAMTGSKKRLSYKPWLKESIDLRSPMIHPLNILQILAQQNHEIALLRLTVTGISAGMMATG